MPFCNLQNIKPKKSKSKVGGIIYALYFFSPSSITLFRTREKLTDFVEDLISFACNPRNFSMFGSSKTTVTLTPIN